MLPQDRAANSGSDEYWDKIMMTGERHATGHILNW